jgi:hypothetical protein
MYTMLAPVMSCFIAQRNPAVAQLHTLLLSSPLPHAERLMEPLLRGTKALARLVSVSVRGTGHLPS